MSADFSPRPKDRLDTVLALRGLCDSREQAKRLILAGEVIVNGHAATKPGHVVKPDDVIVLKTKPRYVSRGGLKLEGALTSFNIDPTGLTCLDAGASTGGFTDCLLQHRAAKVYAFDVGTNQLVWKIRSDSRVTAREQFNLRQLQPADVPEPIDLAVFDLSFISLTLILPAVMAVLHPDHGQLICLIKPQFELRREDVGAGGIVRDSALHQQAADRIRRFVEGCSGFRWRGCVDSPIKGTDGNTEFLAWVSRSSAS